MFLRLLMLILFALSCCFLTAQIIDSTNVSERGTKITSLKKTTPGTTYAVIVGISNYTLIPALQFADKDALLFREFLQSKSGGSVSDSNIYMILNAEAKESILVGIINWINKVNPKQGDRVYFYFAGHGDAIDGDNIFFLLPDCNPDGDRNNYLKGNVIRMFELKSVLFKNNLLKKNVQVILIWDACRSGELKIKTDEIIEQSIAERSNGEIVIMSASAGENAIENKVYANGHGLFTYYFIDGLNGAADKSPNGNDDSVVNINEISKYVTVNVSNDANLKFNKRNQNPKFTYTANPGPLSIIDQQFNQLWLTQKKGIETNSFANAISTTSRSLSAIKDTAINNLYNQCMQAINAGNMEGENGAQALLAKLESKYPSNEMAKDARLNIAMELINLAQEKINLYFSGRDDIKELDSTLKGNLSIRVRKSALSTNATNAAYLGNAINILRRSNFEDSGYIEILESKKYFLLARSYHMNEKILTNKSDAFEYIWKAIRINPKAAYNYHMLALLFQDEKNYDSAIKYESEAVRLAPNWNYVLKGLGNYMEKKGNRISAIRYYKMVFQNNPNYAQTYDAYIIYNDLGNNYYSDKQYDSAIYYFKQSIKIEPGKVYARYYKIGSIYNLQNQPDSALSYFKIAIAMKPDYIEALNNAGNAYIYKEMYDSAIVMYNQVLKFSPAYLNAFTNLAFIYTKKEVYDSAVKYYMKAIVLKPDDPIHYFRLTSVYFKMKDQTNGYIYLEKALQKGYNNIGAIKQDKNLDSIRETEKFNEMIKKYLPNY